MYNLYIFTITPFLIKKILDIPVGYPTVYFSHGMARAEDGRLSQMFRF